MAPSRTIRILAIPAFPALRSSAIHFSADQWWSVFCIADNRNLAAARNHHVTLRHSLSGIVSALGMNVRTQQTD